MIRVLAIFGCCLLLLVGNSLEESLESQEVVEGTTPLIDDGFPIISSHELPELEVPSDLDQEVMDAHKINWLPVWEEQEHLRIAREVAEEPSEEAQAAAPDSTLTKAPVVAPVAAPVVPPVVVPVVAPIVPPLVPPVVAPVVAAAPDSTSTKAPAVQEVLLVKDNKQCPNNAQQGLTNLIRVARPLLPAQRLRNILANAVKDPQVQGLARLLRSDPLKEKVQQLRATQQHQALQKFVCQELKLDPAYYVEYVRVFLDIHISEPPTSELPNRRQGIRGLLLDLSDAIPRATLRDMYRHLYSSDSELAKAVRLIRSTKFRRLLRDVRSLKEYRSLTDDLEKAGAPLRQIRQLVANALGWGTVDLDAETIILSV